MKKQWKLLRPDPQMVRRICRHLHCSPVTAAILANRGIVNETEADDFFNPSLSHLTPPFTLQDVRPAVRRIQDALKKNEKILVFGDYDVDGVTATALMVHFLSGIGAHVSHHIPHRTQEGYGLDESHINSIAVPAGVKLIITVDCGSASHAAVEAARGAGIDVIVTDHHQVGASMPDALAVVNPNRPDCSSGLKALSGVGVAFSLLVCLRKALREQGFWSRSTEPPLSAYLDLVALGSIADMVPMRKDNRILTRKGIDLINRAPRPGVRALLAAAGLDQGPIEADHIAFRLAPRINAAGRMDHARKALDLFLCDDPLQADDIAQQLNLLNSHRQKVENQVMAQALDQLARSPDLLQPNSVVLADPDWHEGVLGIVASKLANRFHRPVAVLCDSEGMLKGSARSIPGIHLLNALSACAGHLETYGGHSLAAGLRLKRRRLTQFRQCFEQCVGELADPRTLIPQVIIDCELFFDQISDSLIDELTGLQPFGSGNPAPLFIAKNIEVVSWAPVGDSHRRMVLRQAGAPARKLGAIWFNADTSQSVREIYHQIAFQLQWNHWNGSKHPQLVIVET